MKITLHKMDDNELWLTYGECIENAVRIKDEIQKRCSLPRRSKRAAYNKKRKSNADRYFS